MPKDSLTSTKHNDSDDRQIEKLMDAMVDAIVVTDHDGTVTHFNAAASDLFKYSADEVIGKSVNFLMGKADASRHDGFMGSYHKTGKRKIIGIGRDVKAQKKGGALFDMHLSVGEMGVGRSTRFVGLIRDISARKTIEDKVIRHQDELLRVGRLTTMGEMAAAMAHELNQPLTAISNYSNACSRLLERAGIDNEDVTRGLSAINDQSHRAGEIIRRLRDFLKFEVTEKECIAVRDLVAEVLPFAELDATANDIVFDVEIEDALPMIEVDRLQIQQVLLNLLRNGVDAMAESDPTDRQLSLNVQRSGRDKIEFRVSDRGSGVPDYLRAELFDAFVTTKEKGMGMGLAICRTIVEMHEGFLMYQNNSDAGATFYFSLPISHD